MPHAKPTACVLTTEIDARRAVVYRRVIMVDASFARHSRARSASPFGLGESLRRAGWLIFLGAWASACGPKTVPAPPRPLNKGDLLRFMAKKGDEPKASIKLVVEQEAGASQGAKKSTGHVAFTLAFVEEERVDVISADGSAQISARLVDAVGTPGTGFKQEVVDQLALAFDELKIQFKRSPRGDVTDLSFSGMKKPLDENTVRAVFNAVYLAGRGSIFSE